ncbi:hypothetical protein [Streptomyces sp. NPDC057287]|uniref:hypothetical protein n=1 Tax=Streptomyces sp. NPDC057287 TaxID=3346086 RepID=UPI00363536D5
MEFCVPLVIRNISLDDDETVEKLALSLSDLGWRQVAGQVLASVYTTQPDPVASVVAAAHHIKRELPHAVVERVDEQFVSLADIAARAGLSHEAVRLWATGKRRTTGKPFPAARSTVGQGQTTTKIWVWPEVMAWLKAQYCLDLEPGTAHLDAQQVARVNAALCESPQTDRWRRTSTASLTRTLEATSALLGEDVPSGPNGRRLFAEPGTQR